MLQQQYNTAFSNHDITQTKFDNFVSSNIQHAPAYQAGSVYNSNDQKTIPNESKLPLTTGCPID
jgi:hypothetical protein